MFEIVIITYQVSIIMESTPAQPDVTHIDNLTGSLAQLSAEEPELASHSSHFSTHSFDPITGLDASEAEAYVSPCGSWRGNSVDTFEWLDLDEKARDMFIGKLPTMSLLISESRTACSHHLLFACVI